MFPTSLQFFILLNRTLFALLCVCSLATSELEFLPLTDEFIKLLEHGYNKFATPTQLSGTATNVSMSMYIEGISSFSAQTMDFSLDFYFYQEWNDARLSHNGTGPIAIRDREIFKRIWHPDVYFANARSASFQEITEPNFLVWVYPNGHVWYDCRVSLTAICMMDLYKYPLDEQQCNLRLLSYAYPESQVRLLWSTTIDPPIERSRGIRMPDMRLVDIKTGECDGTYTTGKWSCMTAIFYVRREMMHHIIQTYIPTALIVIISWFNFWLDIDSAPARVSLSITTLLTIATQANAVKLALPEVSYMKAIDFWLGTCMTFVFAVMVEFTVCHYAKNHELAHAKCPVSNLIVDTTFSSLFGSAPTASSTSTSMDQSSVSMRTAESRRQFLRSSFRKCSTLRADEPDIHTIRTQDLEPMLTKNEIYSHGTAKDVRLSNIHSSLTYHYDHSNNNGSTRSYRDSIQPETLRMTDQHNIKPAVSKLKNQVSKRAMNLRGVFCNLRGRAIANRIDENCRYAFPLAFTVFNFFYWVYYLWIN